MFSLFSNPHLSTSLSAPAFPLGSPEQLPVADDALATALTSSGSISEPCSPTMGASFDAVPSAFASEQAALLSPYRADQRQQHDKMQGHSKVSADGPAAPAAPAAASAQGRPPLGRPVAGGSSGLHRSSGAHLKPHSVDAEWDPINAQGSIQEPDVHLMQDQFAAMRATSINRYQSSGPTHLEFPLYY
ncbi:hypothetical protein ABPG77_005776 [Micractinium sp. CCAP 211/92]